MTFDAVPEQIRECRRILRMISELHVRGYQRLRIIPHIASVGAWRGGVTFVGNVRSDHGALPCTWEAELLPQHTSASGRDCFGWNDARLASPSRLADMFIERFPRVAGLGLGADWEYAGWYSWMLHETHPDTLPVAQGEYVKVPPGGLVTEGNRSIRLIPPPPGLGAPGAP